MSKSSVICVVGATGNQGGSVARRFLKDPKYHVRGVTRDASSAAAKQLAELGVEVIQADLDDVDSLKSAFSGANMIFSVTNYWEPFFRPDCRDDAQKQGISCRKYAYNVEYSQGKNIADAAASTVATLDKNGFLVSTLSHAGKCSQGAFKELYHFDAKADIFPDYVAATYPELSAKMSCIQTGYFTSSYKLISGAWLAKQSDGSFRTSFSTIPDAPVPHLAVNADTGNFVYAVAQMPPGHDYMAAGTMCSWTEYMQLWARTTGKAGRYEQVTLEQLMPLVPDQDFAVEVDDMFSYSSKPGYDGGMKLLTAEDIRKEGIECPMTSLEAWMQKEDWAPVFAQ